MDHWQCRCCETACHCLRALVGGITNNGLGTGDNPPCYCCDDLNGEYLLRPTTEPAGSRWPRVALNIYDDAQDAGKICTLWSGRRVLGEDDPLTNYRCFHFGLYIVQVGGDHADDQVNFYGFFVGSTILSGEGRAYYLCPEIVIYCYEWQGYVQSNPHRPFNCRTEIQNVYLYNVDMMGTNWPVLQKYCPGTPDNVCDVENSSIVLNMLDEEDCDCTGPTRECSANCVTVEISGLQGDDCECMNGIHYLRTKADFIDIGGDVEDLGYQWIEYALVWDEFHETFEVFPRMALSLQGNCDTGDIWLVLDVCPSGLGSPIQFARIVWYGTPGTGSDYGTWNNAFGLDCLELVNVPLNLISCRQYDTCDPSGASITVTFDEIAGTDMNLDCAGCEHCEENRVPDTMLVIVTPGEYDDCDCAPESGTYTLDKRVSTTYLHYLDSCVYELDTLGSGTASPIPGFKLTLAITKDNITVTFLKHCLNDEGNPYLSTIEWGGGSYGSCGNMICEDLYDTFSCSSATPCDCEDIPDIQVQAA